MTVAFKHMTRENARRLTQGEIRIGSFAYYHDAEHSAAIRDTNEGTTIGRTGSVILTSLDKVETIVAGLKFATQSGGIIDISGCQFVRSLPPLYIFSTSLVGSVGHFDGYDAVIKINDIEQFGCIFVDGRRDAFDEYWSGLVKYQPVVYDALNHSGLDPSPFVKDIAFKRDEEFRLVFAPIGTVEQHLTFSLDRIKQAFNDGLCELLP